MHPHGIIPLQAVLWAAYCDQYLSDTGTDGSHRALYGFGAAANAVLYVPFLRNMMAWLAADSADYPVLRRGLLEGKSPVVNKAGRTPKHLYILPGGIAEIFTSQPGKDICLVRSGILRLSLDTKTPLIPVYVFGGTYFFENALTSDTSLSKLFRKLRLGATLFWGQFYSPVLPMTPRVTMVVGTPQCVAPLPAPASDDDHMAPDRVATLLDRYTTELRRLFGTYAAAAGYRPDRALLINPGDSDSAGPAKQKSKHA